ncbi:RHS repeat domain-containing protein, partial [Zooshikella harenae]
NTPRRATNTEGNIVWAWYSDAYGVGQVADNPDGDGQSVTLNLRFPGQYYDAESGLFYNYFRDYDPSSGRYLESDPIGLKGGLNTYGYVGGNPVKYIDQFGLAYSPMGEHGIPRESNDDCGCLAKAFGFETAAGAGMAVAGAPIIPYPRKGVDGKASTGATSPISKRLSQSKRIPRHFPRKIRVPAPTLKNPFATTNVIGRAAGRWVPIFGWGLLANDYRQLMQCFVQCEKDKKACQVNE